MAINADAQNKTRNTYANQVL